MRDQRHADTPSAEEQQSARAWALHVEASRAQQVPPQSMLSRVGEAVGEFIVTCIVWAYRLFLLALLVLFVRWVWLL
jgi:hypothetical protein